MRRRIVLMVLLGGALQVTVLLGQKDQSRPASAAPTFHFETGVRSFAVDGERPGKFREYRDTANGFFIARFDFAFVNEKKAREYRFSGRNVIRQDQEFFFSAKHWGRSETHVVWSQTPHFFSNASRSLLSLAGQRVQTALDLLQKNLEVVEVIPPTPASDAGAAALVRDALSQADPLDLELRRDFFAAAHSIELGHNWIVRATLTSERRRGRRALGNGTYVRTGDNFEVLGMELAEPIRHHSTDMEIGVHKGDKQLSLGGGYAAHVFRNGFDSIQFENPFRFTDAQGLPPDGGRGRGRFARAEVSLPPDNTWHEWFVNARYAPSSEHTATADLRFSFGRQNQPFLPYTLNTAIVAANLGGLSPTSLEALPVKSYDGKIFTWNQKYQYAVRLWKDLKITSSYRHYRYDNDSPTIEFPGYAAFLDSFWRTSISTQIAGVNEPIESVPQSYDRHQVNIMGDWAIHRNYSLGLEARWERWDRTHRNANRTDDVSLGGNFHALLRPYIDLRVSYLHSNRVADAYDPGILEFAKLRVFDQANRTRSWTNAQVNFEPWHTFSFGAEATYQQNRYDDSVYGLTANRSTTAGFSGYWQPHSTVQFHSGYALELFQYEINGITKTAGPPYNPRNDWVRNGRDLFHTGNLGWSCQPVSRMDLGAEYSVAWSKGTMDTRNPLTPLSTNGVASPFPDVYSKLHTLEISAKFSLTEKLGLNARYFYEPFRLSDFRWDQSSPYMFGIINENAARFLFLDSRYGNYTAHGFLGTLQYSF